MQQLFRITLGVDYAARDTGRRIVMCVRETDSLAAAIKAEQIADGRLEDPATMYTHAMSVRSVGSVPMATMPLPIAA